MLHRQPVVVTLTGMHLLAQGSVFRSGGTFRAASALVRMVAASAGLRSGCTSPGPQMVGAESGSARPPAEPTAADKPVAAAKR